MAKEIKVHITDPVGLYATPATELFKAIKVFNCQVNLHYEDKTVNMKSMSLIFRNSFKSNCINYG